MPTRIARYLLRTVFQRLFRMEISGLENYHAAGPRVLVVANHVSLLDGVLLYLFLPDRPTFAIDPYMAGKWYVRPLLRFIDRFEINPADPLAIKSMVRCLRENRKAVIFPEGRITVTGSLMKIYDGPSLIADRAEASILPVAIEGAQYTPLSYLRGLVRIRRFPKVRLTFLPPVRLPLPPGITGPARRKAAARALRDIMLNIAYTNSFHGSTLFDAVIEAMSVHGPWTIIAEDSQRQPLSYRQLLTRTFVLGAEIARQTQAGEYVGVLLPNSTAVLTVFLALHSRGRVPAMLNFTAGLSNILTACETARVRTIYTSRKFIETAHHEPLADALAERYHVVYLEDLRARIGLRRKLWGTIAARFPSSTYHRLHPDRNPEAAAVVLFTSGSEGVPKGVVLSHRNLLANCAQTRALIELSHRDTLLNVLPVFHSFGLTAGTLLPLLNGTRIFFYPTPLHYHIIPELCYELGASILFGTNTFLAGYARHAHPYDFYRMRYVIAGAEKLQSETRRFWHEHFGIRILEGYGVTETSPVISVNTPHGNKFGTVGRLVPGMEYRLEPVEGIHRGGRLLVRGPNVMCGYLYHGSEGKVIPPAAGSELGWHDTGDIVDIDGDGYMTIIGRAKRFAKIGGEMVSLAAVEELATTVWPQAKHAAISVPDARKGEHIVLLTDQADADRHLLLEMARQIGVDEREIPRRIEIIDEMPLLGSGKIDYRLAQSLAEKRLESTA